VSLQEKKARKEQKKKNKSTRVEKRVALNSIASDKTNAKATSAVAFIFQLVESNSTMNAGLLFCNPSGVHYMLRETTSPNWYRYAQVDEIEFYKYGLTPIKNSHFAFVAFDGDEDAGRWHVRDIPRKFLPELKSLEKNNYLPKQFTGKPSPNDVSYACISFEVQISGKGWKMSTIGTGKARELYREECAKIDAINGLSKEDVEDEDLEDYLASEYDEIRRVLFERRQRPIEFIVCEDHVPAKKFSPSNQKKRSLTLQEFHSMVRGETRAKLAVIECPNMVKQFGCTAKNCKFNHPVGWCFKSANNKLKEAQKNGLLVQVVAQAPKQAVVVELTMDDANFPPLV
jgi:hypothetical protein